MMAEPEPPRQRIERASGTARRARLTPAPGSDPAPEAPVDGDDDRDAGPSTDDGRPGSSDDDRLTRDRPPHWRRT